MTPEAMAEIHAKAMRVPPPWDAAAMADLLAAPGAIYVSEADCAFALGRIIAGEAELLTMAVDPARQGNGVGRACLKRFLAECRGRGAARILLDVAATNAAARALYASEGFVEDGVRKGYYRVPGGGAVDAVLMSLHLAPDEGA